jgi:hypothetical protein
MSSKPKKRKSSGKCKNSKRVKKEPVAEEPKAISVNPVGFIENVVRAEAEETKGVSVTPREVFWDAVRAVRIEAEETQAAAKKALETDLDDVLLVFSDARGFFRLDANMNTGGQASLFAGKGETVVDKTKQSVKHRTCVHCSANQGFEIIITNFKKTTPVLDLMTATDSKYVIDGTDVLMAPRSNKQNLGPGKMIEVNTEKGHKLRLHFAWWNAQRKGVCLVSAEYTRVPGADKPAVAKLPEVAPKEETGDESPASEDVDDDDKSTCERCKKVRPMSRLALNCKTGDIYCGGGCAEKGADKDS